MSKRDTDTEIWSEDWFLNLSDIEMLFWNYIKDKCDHAGFWRPNFKIFETITGRRVNVASFLEKINSDKQRIEVIENGKWFLTGFISFQYCGKLNLNNRFHKSVYDTFTKNISHEKSQCYNFEVCLTSLRGLVDLNKEQETKNEEQRKKKGDYKGGENENRINSSFKEEDCKDEKDFSFTTFWNAYPKKKDKGHAVKAWSKISKPKETLELILNALKWQKESIDWKKENGQYIPMPSTYLNGRRWEDEHIKKIDSVNNNVDYFEEARNKIKKARSLIDEQPLEDFLKIIKGNSDE